MKTILAVALSVAAVSASADPRPYTHYHTADGRVVIGNQIADRVSTTYTTDAYGRRVRVVTTVRCTEVDRSPRSNHIFCTEEETTVQRFFDDNYRPGYGIVNPGYGYRHYEYRDPAAGIIGGVVREIQRDNRRDDRHDGRWDRGNDHRGDNRGHDNDRHHDRDGHDRH